MVLEKTLESPLDCKEMQPVRSKEISPGCSLEGMMLKLKVQYFGHLMGRTDTLENTLMLGKIEGRRRRGANSNVGRSEEAQATVYQKHRFLLKRKLKYRS